MYMYINDICMIEAVNILRSRVTELKLWCMPCLLAPYESGRTNKEESNNWTLLHVLNTESRADSYADETQELFR